MAKRKSVSFAELAEDELRTPPVQRTYSRKRAATTSKKKRASQKTLTQIDFIKRHSPAENLDLELQYELPPSAQKEPPSKRVKRERSPELIEVVPSPIVVSPRRPHSESRLGRFLKKPMTTWSPSKLHYSPNNTIQSSQADEAVSPILLRTPTRKLMREIASSQSPEPSQISPIRPRDSPRKRIPLAPISSNLSQTSVQNPDSEIMEEKSKIDRPLFRKPIVLEDDPTTIDLTHDGSQSQAELKSRKPSKSKRKSALKNDQSKLSLEAPTQAFTRPKRVKVLHPDDDPVEAEAEFDISREFTKSFATRDASDTNLQKRGPVVLDSAQTSFDEPIEAENALKPAGEEPLMVTADGRDDDVPAPDTESLFPDPAHTKIPRVETRSVATSGFQEIEDPPLQHKPKRDSLISTFKHSLTKIRTAEELFDEHATPLGRSRPTAKEQFVPPPSSPQLPASSSAFWNAETYDDEAEAMLPISHDTLQIMSDRDGNMNVVIPSSIPELSESQILPASLMDFTIRRPPVLEQESSNTWNMSTQE